MTITFEEEERPPWEIAPSPEGLDLIAAGVRLQDSWTRLAYTEPPKGIIERFFWSIGILVELVVSIATFPAAIGAFLLEEATQSMGMGAYILWSAKSYELLESYMEKYKTFILVAKQGAETLSYLNPMAGGAVQIYMWAARQQAAAFDAAIDQELTRQAERDKKAREDLLEKRAYGELAIRSSPSNAEIWLNGEDTEKLTPETIKELPTGDYVIELRKYSKQRDVWDIFAFVVNVRPGFRKEIFIDIPSGVHGEEDVDTGGNIQDKNLLPDWINAEVVGSYALDGDTIETTEGERIRLLAIDAPELGQPWADISKEYLNSLIEDKNLTIRIQTSAPLDKYGRTLAFVKSYKGDCSKLLLISGLARLFVGTDAIYDPTPYEAAEILAKARKVGIWSNNLPLDFLQQYKK